jgi:hypothetical protein
MKVLLHYEENEQTALQKSLKITLPKSWKSGPTSQLLSQFIESYNGNASFAENQLQESEMHLCIRQVVGTTTSDEAELVPLASNAVVLEAIPDRADVYICHGPSFTLEEKAAETAQALKKKQEELASTVACTHFACKKRFPAGGPYPECQFHKAPPVFHETAKFWSCCPNKKAYDWEDFQNIPGCETGVCSEVKDAEGKMFLGGSDLRDQAADAPKLKSIDDFNKSQDAGSEAAPVLERLQGVLEELGVEKELFDQVIEGFKKEFADSVSNEAELLELVSQELGDKLKKSMKSIAVDQLRLK